MYFPIGWPKTLHLDGNDAKLLYVASNLERLLFAILTEDSICLWYCKPSVQIFCYRRSDHSVYEFGINQTAVWKPNSSMVAVSTSRGYIIFYEVQLDNANKQATLFTQKEQRCAGGRTEVVTVGDNLHVPSLKLCHVANVQVSGGVKSMVCLREEVLVSTGLGLLQRVRWDGYVRGDMTIEIAIIPFSLDLQHSRASQMAEENVFVTAMQYSPLLAGFAVVLSNGKAAFMTADTLKFEPSQVVGVWVQEMCSATTVAINHKYMLMAFGCSSGEGVVYHLDEVTGALVVSNRLVVSSKDFPGQRKQNYANILDISFI